VGKEGGKGANLFGVVARMIQWSLKDLAAERNQAYILPEYRGGADSHTKAP